MESGLPHPRVIALARGDDGFLWLATPRGLARFDGMRFLPFDTAASLAGITALARGSGNRIWIGAADGSIHVMENNMILRDAGQLPRDDTDRITGLAEDASGTLWINTSSGRVACLSESGRTARYARWNIHPNKPLAIKSAPEGTVWAGGEMGWWLAADVDPSPLPTPPIQGPLRYFASGTGGRCWFGTDDGALLAEANQTIHRIELPTLHESPCTAVDGTGGLWVAPHSGALHYCGADGSHAEISLHDRRGPLSVQALLADSENLVWVGTDNGGLSQITPALFHRLENPAVVSQLSPGQGGSGASPPGNQIVIEPRSEGVVASKHTHVLPPHQPDPNGGGNLSAIAGMLAKLPDQSSIHVIFTDTDKSLWLGRSGPSPLLHYKGGGFQTTTFTGPTPEGVSSLARDTQGNLWIGTTSHGIFRLGDDGNPQAVGLPFGNANTSVRNILVDPNSVWFTTAGSGLYRWKNGTFKAATRGAGLPDDDLFAIQADQADGLWLSSASGFFRMNHAALDAWFDGLGPFPHPVVFDESDGVKSIEGFPDSHNGARITDSGHIWFSCSGGVYEVRPSLHQVPPHAAPAAVAECLADGVKITGPAQMPPGTRRVEFHVTGLTLAHPESVRFSCRLVPRDADWVDMGLHRTMTYSGLPPGQYRFEVCATDRYGRRSPSPAKLDFLMPAPFWMSRWFGSLCLLSALGGVLFLIKAFVNARLKPLRERERIEMALAEERRRIARDMHDELGTGLCEIALLGNRLEQSAPQHSDAGRVARRARELAQSIDETVWMLNPRNDTLENLATYLAHAVTKWSHSTPLRPRFDIGTSLEAIRVPTSARRHLYLACKEMTHNAVKHSGGSEMWLRIHTRAGGFVIEMSDNGTGMPAQPNPVRSGLANLRERMAEIGGTIEIGRSSTGGARLTLSIPLPLPEPPPTI